MKTILFPSSPAYSRSETPYTWSLWLSFNGCKVIFSGNGADRDELAPGVVHPPVSEVAIKDNNRERVVDTVTLKAGPKILLQGTVSSEISR